ncbi:MAG TPA: DUF1778 domain-containing protein [Caulobacteraceae bacterium]|nr:DUF1778 domain-containing protein [Caulobacteraceae bacterium]
MRLRDADVAVIDRAAELRGRSRTDFMREAALREAESVLMEQAAPRLEAQAFAVFQAALAAPATAVPEMVEVLTRPAPWEHDGTAA